MAKVTDASNTAWSAGTVLAADEVWQVHDGSVLLDTDPVEANRLGIRLNPGDSLRIASGKTVYYRLAYGTAAIIARFAV